MSSNYVSHDSAETVREADQREVRCNICHGSGLEIVHGQETDCIECEGWGSILV